MYSKYVLFIGEPQYFHFHQRGGCRTMHEKDTIYTELTFNAKNLTPPGTNQSCIPCKTSQGHCFLRWSGTGSSGRCTKSSASRSRAVASGAWRTCAHGTWSSATSGATKCLSNSVRSKPNFRGEKTSSPSAKKTATSPKLRSPGKNWSRNLT